MGRGGMEQTGMGTSTGERFRSQRSGLRYDDSHCS